MQKMALQTDPGISRPLKSLNNANSGPRKKPDFAREFRFRGENC